MTRDEELRSLNDALKHVAAQEEQRGFGMPPRASKSH